VDAEIDDNRSFLTRFSMVRKIISNDVFCHMKPARGYGSGK